MHSFPPLSRRRNVEMLTVVQRAAGWPSEFDKFTSEQLRQHWRPQELKHRNRRSSNPQMNNSRFFILFYFFYFLSWGGPGDWHFLFWFFFIRIVELLIECRHWNCDSCNRRTVGGSSIQLQGGSFGSFHSRKIVAELEWNVFPRK